MSIFAGIRRFIKWCNRSEPFIVEVKGFTFPDSNLLSIYSNLQWQNVAIKEQRTNFWVGVVKSFAHPPYKLGVVIYGREEKPEDTVVSDTQWQTLLDKGYIEDCKDWELIRWLVNTLPTNDWNYNDPELVSLLGLFVYQGGHDVFQAGLLLLTGNELPLSDSQSALIDTNILCTFVAPDDDPEMSIDIYHPEYFEICQHLLRVALQQGYIIQIHPLRPFPYRSQSEEQEKHTYPIRKPLRQSDLNHSSRKKVRSL